MIEIWKDIEGYEGLYKISTLGRVKGLTSGIILKSALSVKGYPRVNLSKDNSYKTKVIHRLVAINFIENSNNKKQVNHINGVKTDNNVENLEWCNQSHNIQHAYDNGLKLPNTGIKNGRAKITEKTAINIISDLNNGIKNVDIVNKYNVTKDTVTNIKYKKAWKHLQ